MGHSERTYLNSLNKVLPVWKKILNLAEDGILKRYYHLGRWTSSCRIPFQHGHCYHNSRSCKIWFSWHWILCCSPRWEWLFLRLGRLHLLQSLNPGYRRSTVEVDSARTLVPQVNLARFFVCIKFLFQLGNWHGNGQAPQFPGWKDILCKAHSSNGNNHMDAFLIFLKKLRW